MLIGIDASRAFRARRTGTERYAWEIIHHLLKLPAAGQHFWRLYVDTDVADNSFPTQTPRSRQANIELCQLPQRRLWTHRVLAREVIRRRPDVLFIPSHVVPFLLPSNRLPNCVVTVHDLGYHYFPAAHTPFQRIYLDWSTRWSAKVAHSVIAVSQATAEDLHRIYAVRFGKIHIIYEAVSALPAPSPAEINSVTNRNGLKRPYALYLGTIQPRKNLSRLILAYARLSATEAPPWDLVLAGNRGWLSQSLDDLINSKNLSERIHLSGYVPEADLPSLLAGARFFCFPSLFEGFGLPVLEAHSIGVPVLTSNTSSLPEVAGDAALYVDPTDVDAIAEAMLRLSQDEALRQQLIEAVMRTSSAFPGKRLPSRRWKCSKPPPRAQGDQVDPAIKA